MPGLIESRQDCGHRGTATAVSNRVSRRQAGWASQEEQQAAEQQQYAPRRPVRTAAPAAPPADMDAKAARTGTGSAPRRGRADRCRVRAAKQDPQVLTSE
jgi:hypothetical protein